MMRALWTDSSCPECYPLQPCLYRGPVPFQGEQGRWKPREEGYLPRIAARLRRCQAWNQPPPPLNLSPSALRGDSAKPCFTSPFPQH